MPSENLSLVAVWRKESVSDYTVTFNYGNISFDGTTYLDTGLPLFSNDYVYKDFDISLDVKNSTFLKGQNSDMNSVVACMDEANTTAYPGFVFRRNASKFSFIANSNSDIKYDGDYDDNQITIQRIDDKLKLNGNEILDYTYLDKTFNNPLTIGAAFDKNNSPFRYFKGDVEGITVKLKYDNAKDYTILEPKLINTNCIFTGWTGSNGYTPQKDIIILEGNTENKFYTANFNCS